MDHTCSLGYLVVTELLPPRKTDFHTRSNWARVDKKQKAHHSPPGGNFFTRQYSFLKANSHLYGLSLVKYVLKLVIKTNLAISV
jgi:hypothetical protein